MSNAFAACHDRAVATATGGWIFYDASCGVCGRWVPRWAPWLAARGIAVAALQEPWVGERTGLTRDQLLADITLHLKDGATLRGADAYRYLLRSSLWTRPLALLAATPGFRGLFDAAYRAFARHRYAVSRICRLDPPTTR
jgi:predicted DCC family thiol-disulfide oxidoreductase YuxK